MSDVAAIVLAAGRGTRFGEAPKLLAELGGVPLVRHAVLAALASSASPVLVVTGHRAEEVGTALAGTAVLLLHNPAYADGLSTSVRAGFAALPETAGAAVVMLGDMPLVSAGLVDALIDRWRECGRPDAVAPTVAGRRGNPVLLSRRLAPEIARLSGDAGAGPLLRGRSGIVELEMDDPAATIDIDTPDSLAALDQLRTTPSSTAE